MKVKRFYNDMYKWKFIYIEFSDNEEEAHLKKICKECHIDKSTESEIINNIKNKIIGGGMCYCDFNKKIATILLYNPENSLDKIGTQVHEMYHAVTLIQNFIEYNPNNSDGDEPGAYFMGWLARHILC